MKKLTSTSTTKTLCRCNPTTNMNMNMKNVNITTRPKRIFAISSFVLIGLTMMINYQYLQQLSNTSSNTSMSLSSSLEVFTEKELRRQQRRQKRQQEQPERLNRRRDRKNRHNHHHHYHYQQQYTQQDQNENDAETLDNSSGDKDNKYYAVPNPQQLERLRSLQMTTVTTTTTTKNDPSFASSKHGSKRIVVDLDHPPSTSLLLSPPPIKQQQQQVNTNSSSNDIDNHDNVEMIMIHSVLTRFMVGQAGIQQQLHHQLQKQQQNQQQHTNTKTITYSYLAKARLLQFETFCLPTMQSQTFQNYYWIILVDPRLDISILLRIKQLLNSFPNAFMILTTNSDWAADGIGVPGVSTYGVNILDIAKQATKLSMNLNNNTTTTMTSNLPNDEESTFHVGSDSTLQNYGLHLRVLSSSASSSNNDNHFDDNNNIDNTNDNNNNDNTINITAIQERLQSIKWEEKEYSIETGNLRYLQELIQNTYQYNNNKHNDNHHHDDNNEPSSKKQQYLMKIETILDADDGMHQRAMEWIQQSTFQYYQETTQQMKNKLQQQQLQNQQKQSSSLSSILHRPRLSKTWSFVCPTRHLEWHNRDIYKHVIIQQQQRQQQQQQSSNQTSSLNNTNTNNNNILSVLSSGIVGYRDNPTFCVSAGTTRFGWTISRKALTFPLDAYMNHAWITSHAPPCPQSNNNNHTMTNESSSSSSSTLFIPGCWRRDFAKKNIVLRTRAVTSDSMGQLLILHPNNNTTTNNNDTSSTSTSNNIDSILQDYRDLPNESPNIHPLVYNQSEQLWIVLQRKFHINRYQAYQTSVFMQQYFQQIIFENSVLRCAPGFPCHENTKETLEGFQKSFV